MLGTDKRNPVFTVYRAEPAAAASLPVYYGAELLEVVPEDRRHPAFKLLIGRLYNAGVKAVTLQRSFGVDRKTMQRWGRALQSEDPQQLVQALAGRGPRKLTPEIRAFVTMRLQPVIEHAERQHDDVVEPDGGVMRAQANGAFEDRRVVLTDIEHLRGVIMERVRPKLRQRYSASLVN